jgi:hypothetical protein
MNEGTKRQETSKANHTYDSLPLGTRFRYIGGTDIWVKIENGGTGVIAKWDGPHSSRILQSICSFAESEEERATLEVELAESPSHEMSDVADAAKWRALRNCARITALGSAGIVTQRPNNYAHLTLNFWTVHDTPGDPMTLAWFDEFVEIAQRAQADPALKASE